MVLATFFILSGKKIPNQCRQQKHCFRGEGTEASFSRILFVSSFEFPRMSHHGRRDQYFHRPRSNRYRLLSSAKSRRTMYRGAGTPTSLFLSGLQKSQHTSLVTRPMLLKNDYSSFSFRSTAASSSSASCTSRRWASSTKASSSRIPSSTSSSLLHDNNSDNNLKFDPTMIDTEIMEKLLENENWKDYDIINPTLQFKTWLVPSRSLSRLIKEPMLQPLLANANHVHNDNDSCSSGSTGGRVTTTNQNNNDNSIILQHIHPRIKMIQDYNNTHKLLLRSPVTIVATNNKTNKDYHCNVGAANVQDFLDQHSVVDGPIFTTQISYKQLSLQYIISQLVVGQKQQERSSDGKLTTSATMLYDLPTAYEQIGHIAHFNFKQKYQDCKLSHLIGQVLVNIHPTISMVVHKVGQVTGPYRTYPLEVLATTTTSKERDDNHLAISTTGTETTLTEHGMAISLDISKCYWCSRLSGERQVLLKDISSWMKRSSKSTNPKDDDDDMLIADVFCGVGTLCLLANRELPKCHIMANDWNPSAIEYFEQNLKQNAAGGAAGGNNSQNSTSSSSIDPSMFALSCVDSYEYLMDLGLGNIKLPSSIVIQEEEVAGEDLDSDDSSVIILPHHIIMNYPLEAPTFLGALRWWQSQALQQLEATQRPLPRVHVYTFARADRDSDNEHGGISASSIANNGNAIRTEEEVAIDLVANSLLPGFDGPQLHRGEEFNQDYSADFSTRIIRDVAPGKVCICVSFTVTSKLIRHMQGDYYDDE